MAQVAFLILAHENTVLPHLLQSLLHDKCDIFVHFDAKATFQAEVYSKFVAVKFVEKRRNVYWGGFNMILATLDLIRAARTKSSASHFFLLSGDSILIVSTQSIINYCAAFNGSLIDIKNVPYLPELYGVAEREAKKFHLKGSLAEKSWRFENYTFLDSEIANPRVSLEDSFAISGEVEKIIRRNFHRSVGMIFSTLPRRQHIFDQNFTGSQWWGLSARAIDRVLEMAEKKEFIDYFRFMKIPDEQLFQTVLGNMDGEARKDSPIFMNWKRRRSDGTSALTMEDLISARSKGKFFARKQIFGYDGHLDELLMSGRLISYLDRKLKETIENPSR